MIILLAKEYIEPHSLPDCGRIGGGTCTNLEGLSLAVRASGDVFAEPLCRRPCSSIGIGLLRGMDDESARISVSGIRFDTGKVSMHYSIVPALCKESVLAPHTCLCCGSPFPE